MKEFVKATIIGGLLFLLPVVLVLYFLGTAVGATTEAVQPRQISADAWPILGLTGKLTPAQCYA